ncbi:dihydrouridine synthase-domain-containing protein [Tricladium varicosporioides]|nr:dihydrouridine synthase-domain-containing protein [Hymenoscyphus varicosporioides]
MATASSSVMNSNVRPVVNGTKKKLHGREFYESIGCPKFILAPMVDQSEFAWRMLTRSFMPPSSPQDLLAYTPMLHARMFNETSKFRYNHFQPLREPLASPPNPPDPLQTLYLDGNPTFDRPLTVQFCANDPDELLAAAKYVTPYCDAVDLNLGCPQGIARKGKYGAFLQEDQDLIFKLINKLHKELDVPVTAKIRILDTREQTLEYARNVVKAGASILTVHGRTREMKGHKTGLADWSTIRWLRESLPREVVMFANGNILNRGDIERCLEETGVDGVMSAEGNLYDPAIFATPPAVGEEGREYWRGKDGKGGWRMDAVMRRYMDILYIHILEVPPPTRPPLYLPSDPEPSPPAVGIHSNNDGKRSRISQPGEESGPPQKKQKRQRGEKTQNPNFLAMQPHLFHLLRSLVKKHHNVRDALARSRAGDIEAFENVLQMVEAAVKSGIQQYSESNGKTWEDEVAEEERISAEKEAEVAKENVNGNSDKEEVKDEQYESSIETVRECRRPWWVCQPYVRPLPKEALAKGSLTLSKKERAKMEADVVRAKKEMVESRVEEERLRDEVKGQKVEVPKEGVVCG